MHLKLQEIQRVATITKEEFLENYFKPQKPVVIEAFDGGWAATSKWSFEYIKQVAGDKIVPLYDDRPVHHDDGFNEPHAEMKMSNYIDLLQSKPTKFRIFLWNILKEVPILQQDFSIPDFGIRILKKVPMLFFGGENSHTFMHHDIDFANIFHFHFAGEKQCILFAQSENKFLYRIPFSIITHEGIDFSNPDFEKWPALKNANGYTTKLKHGEVLYMPEGYWHYMKYLSPGFSMSLRTLAHNPLNFLRAAYNIFLMRHIDVLMRKLKGQKWIDAKNKRAITRTNRLFSA
ncbi:cupin-like domain-containing protein [Aurantibacter crassamenti]|uniref:cupin-like domain-containing protein n=1 Tax=Aurantibacter crassamenti TaxID=1837375 RepID=UPI00193AC306|nr:cupin-like domain-containing protein [Aurantibacter crassamenti]MBM1104856.1 cupin-like domain-containing protein [Aurantibacter crassamenti]